jgi:hypothetical protein
MADPVSVTIGVGVITNFVYDGLKAVANSSIQAFAPSAFRASTVLLKEMDREFDDIKRDY